MKNTNFYILMTLIMMMILAFILFGCDPPQSTPPVASKADTVVRMIRDTSLLNALFAQYKDQYDRSSERLGLNEAIIEITVHDTVIKDCPPQFTNLRRVRNFAPVINSFNNSRFDSAVTVIAELRKGTSGSGSVKPTTNIGYTPKQMILPGIVFALIFLVIGGIGGFFAKSKV